MRLILFVAGVVFAAAEDSPIRTYIADLDASSVTLAWGRADGTTRNTIGKGAEGSGSAMVQIDGRALPATGAWLRVAGLKPDTSYPYTLTLNGAAVAAGVVRTWPVKSTRLTFFVIGDFGTGEKAQYQIAKRMEEERVRLEKSNQPVRFVLSVGDTIYGKFTASGSQDRDWDRKFFAPYERTLRAIPFKAILGNHDGNESENKADLAVCLDNFFMPDRWYRMEYASFVELIALDSTTNRPMGRPSPVYLADGEQSKWLQSVLTKPPLPWRLVTMHHPMFTGGPKHKPFLTKAPHWFQAMRNGGVQAVFSGHEHNLQLSERTEATGNMQFVVSGAGGELRVSDIRKKMRERHIAATSNQNHFLVVSITDKLMTIEPVGVEPIHLRDSLGNPATQPVRILSDR